MSECGPGTKGYPSDCELLEGYRAMSRNRKSLKDDADLQPVLTRAASIRLLLLDVDGVLTSGNLFYTNSGDEIKSFNTQDGFGLRILQDAGIEVGIITARKSEIVERRARELRFAHIYQGAPKKLAAFQQICKNTGLKPFEIAYMGDDWLDLVLLNRVGLALSPANGVNEVKEAAHYVCSKTGGLGAVREVCELILHAQNLFASTFAKYQNLSG